MLDRVRSESASLKTGGVEMRRMNQFCGILSASVRSPTGVKSLCLRVEATSILPPEREDCTLVAWYRSLYAPRTGGAYDSHHRTAGIAGRVSVSQALERIRQVAKERKKERFTTLFHHISIDLLDEAFFELKQDAAAGVDDLPRQFRRGTTRAGGNTCGPPSARLDLKAPAVPRSDTDHTGPSISPASMPKKYPS